MARCHACASTLEAESERGEGKQVQAQRLLALVGRPNVGKSALFARLTGAYATVSNYPGTTVEVFQGRAELAGGRWAVVDTPGVLDFASPRGDERVARDVLLFEDVGAVVAVADAKNPELTLQTLIPLAELGLPVVVALNFADERRARGLPSFASRLAEELNIPVVETVALTGEGLSALKAHIASAAVPRIKVNYGPLEHPLQKLAGALEAVERAATDRVKPRGLALLLLALEPEDAEALLSRLVPDPGERAGVRRVLQEARGEAPRPAYAIALARRRAVERVLPRLLPPAPTPEKREPKQKEGWAERLARWTIHPFWGVLVLLGVLYGVYQFVGVLGAQVLVGFFEEALFGEYINPALTALVERTVPWAWLRDLFVGEFGLITLALTYSLALILPIITAFFLAFGLLEDVGYFPRLTVMAHRLFRKMGLSGQAVLPMILGLSCDTMATVTTRVLETRKERVIATLLLALGVPCSAQLAVILAMSAAASPGVLVGVLGIVGMQLLIVGRLAAKLLPGDAPAFIAELPPLRRPRLRNVLEKTRLRLVWYVTEVVPLFVLGALALFVLDKLGILSAFERWVRPVVQELLGLPPEAAAAFILGFFRRDYGAAGLYHLQQAGQLDTVQVLVSLVVITLFVPCIAQTLVIVKERGWRTALAIVAFVLPYAVVVGAIVNGIARAVQGALGLGG